MRRVLIGVGFQCGWFACVLGAAEGQTTIGPIVVACLSVSVLLTGSARAKRAVLAVSTGLVGYFVESGLRAFHLTAFPEAADDSLLCPLWMAALWVNFTNLLELLGDWFGGRPLIAIVAGAALGPLAYAAGASMGAIEISAGGYIALAIIWSIATLALSEAGRSRGDSRDERASAARTASVDPGQPSAGDEG